jgi:uncharacterized membrane protein YbhN (UPF0104 family)/membrane-associated phospholipid phosphatase/tRNA A-37 threonylcarbamoyl transferase component Bud32
VRFTSASRGLTVSEQKRRRAAYRHPGDLARVVLGLTVLAGSTVLARRGDVGTLETDVFRLINHFPESLTVPLMVVMQAGSYGAVVATSALALATRRRRLARDLAAAGTLGWLTARMMKLLVARDRPAVLLDAVLLRGGEAGGLGFPSGHVAVASALATVASPYLGQRARRVTWCIVWLVALSRIHVGVHLPLDVVGGAALGWAVGAALNLLWGAPGGRPSPEAVRQALRLAGLDPADVQPAQVDARGSAPFFARTVRGPGVFVKAIGGDQRTADWLFKAIRFLAFREVEDEAPFATPKQQIEHEAYVGLLAERAGVRTPAIVLATQLSDGTALLGQQQVVGRGLDSLAADAVDDELLRRIWGQVALLRKARIAHRDLRLANVLVDEQGQPWIIDFGFAEAAASDRRLALDVTEMLASLATLVGAEKAVGSALDVLGQEAVTSALPLLQPLALSSATRHDLRGRSGLLKEVRERVALGTGAEPPPVEPLTRVQPRTLLWLIGGAFAIHLLLPQVDELRHTMDALRSVRWEWLVAGGLGATSLYFAAALAIMGAVEHPLAFGRTALVQLAGSFMNRLAPKGLGGMGINERYLERAGVGRPTAVASIAVNMAAGMVVGVLTLAVAGALLGLKGVEQVHLPKNWPYLAAFLVVITLLGLGLFARSLARRRRFLDPVITAGRSLLRVLSSPLQAAQLFGGATGVMVANVLTLMVCLQAFGGDASVLKVIAVYLGGSAIASASPTPGGLGAVEAALVAGLTAVGVQTGPAVAGVLTYRLLTFWLPIIPGFLALRYLQHRQIV